MASVRPCRILLTGLLAAALALAGCGGTQDPGGQGGGGRLAIATGSTSGVYYQVGGGLAELITEHMDGYEATAESTSASVENLERVARGDSDLGFTLADSAADAVAGEASFAEPLPIRALARIYDTPTQVFARAGTGITSVADMRGKRVSSGPPGSGTEVIAKRLLRAAGLDPEADVQRQALGLPETVEGMKEGTVDAMFWSGGLPTGGVTDLTTSMGEDVVAIPVAGLLPAVRAEYGGVYGEATIPADTYGLPEDVATINTPNLIVVNEDMDGQLAHDLAELLIEHQPDLAEAHPAAGGISLETASRTGPVPLHPGARRYFQEAAG